MSYTIGNLREACRNDRIRWSMHAMKRLRERAILPEDFINCIFTRDIIEYYPDDKIMPSCLVSSESLDKQHLHSVSGYDGEYIYAVTAYYPDPSKWESDFKTRKAI